MGFIVIDGKSVINVLETEHWFAGLSKQFFFVVFSKFIGESWAHGNIINLFVQCKIETYTTEEVAGVEISLKSCLKNSRWNKFTVVQNISAGLYRFLFRGRFVNRLEISKNKERWLLRPN